MRNLLAKLFGRKYFIHKTVTIWNKKNLILKNNAQIYEYVIIRARENDVIVGQNTQIGPFCVILVGDGVEIGDNVLIGPHCVFAAGQHNYKQLEQPMIEAGGISKGKIRVGNDVWIGANTTIIDGVTVGDGAVIGANSFVNKDVESFGIYAGAPAKKIANRHDNT